MTARRGGFADRGVRGGTGPNAIVLPSPLLSEMCCRWCRRAGVTVTALDGDDRLLGWCGFDHAAKGGLRLPLRAEAPSPPPAKPHAA